MSRKLSIKALALLLCLLALSGCKSGGEPAAAALTETAPVTTAQPDRTPRSGIQTMLVMGLTEYTPEEGGAFRSGSRSDLLLLIVMDGEKKEAAMLQINPDTAISFTPPGSGEAEEMPLGRVISYGSGGSDSCLNQRKSVSKLLEGVPVDHYMTVTPDDIGVVSDMLGGIPVSPTEKFRQSYPEDCEGETVNLKGELAERFFFSREEEDLQNEDHMERQRRFLTGLFPPFMEKAQDDDFLMKLTLQLGEGFATDLTLSQMVTLLQELGEYELQETIVTLPGSAARIDGEPRFQVEPTEMARLLDDLFYCES